MVFALRSYLFFVVLVSSVTECPQTWKSSFGPFDLSTVDPDSTVFSGFSLTD